MYSLGHQPMNSRSSAMYQKHEGRWVETLQSHSHH